MKNICMLVEEKGMLHLEFWLGTKVFENSLNAHSKFYKEYKQKRAYIIRFFAIGST